MARPLRIEFAGALYHVTARGNAQEDIFGDDNDRHQRGSPHHFCSAVARKNDSRMIARAK